MAEWRGSARAASAQAARTALVHKLQELNGAETSDDDLTPLTTVAELAGPGQLIGHADAGSQYTAIAFSEHLAAAVNDGYSVRCPKT